MSRQAGYYEPLTLGPVDFKAVRDRGRKLLIAYDPTGLHTNAIAISPSVLPLLGFIDGKHSVQELRRGYACRTGTILTEQEVEGLLETMAAAGLLEGPKLAEMRRAANRRFRAGSRPATLAGQAYPKENAAAALSQWFQPPDRPAPADLRGVVLPHIDFRRAPVCYGHATAALAANPADLYVLTGTGHHLARSSIALTGVTYETPLGPVAADTEALALLAGRLGDDAFAEEYAHAREHSLEFAALLLRHALPTEAAPRGVFVLVGSMFNESGLTEPALERLDALAAAISELLAAKRGSGRVLLVAAADLSHVGGRFGDKPIAPADDLGWLESADRADLVAYAAGASQFIERHRSENNARNVCGIAAMYVLRKVLKDCRVEVAVYEQSREPETQSVVTMATAYLR